MRSSSLAAFLTFLWPVTAVSFINPPPPSGTAGDFGSNPVYTESTAIQVAWTDTKDNDVKFSVVVFQVDISKGTDIPSNQAFEYIVRKSMGSPGCNLRRPLTKALADDSVNMTSSPWVVATAKNLTFSNVFTLAIYFEGDTSPRAGSHYFNISRPATAAQPPTTVFITPTPAPSSTSSSAPLTENSPSLSTGATAGVAVGAVAALGLGVAAGWFLSRWNRRRREPQLEVGPAMGGNLNGAGNGPHKGTPSTVFHEVSDIGSPREMGVETTRYELGGTYR